MSLAIATLFVAAQVSIATEKIRLVVLVIVNKDCDCFNEVCDRN